LSEKIKKLRKSALLSTIFTYFLIFIGGLVRVSGAGLGCPDWPKCFGSWIPPLSRIEIPQEFDPATFNMTLAWIEYINRLFGVLLGFFILFTAIFAYLNFRNKRKIVVPAISALVFVIIQGWYGSVVVGSQLEPITVSVHLILALIIVSILIYLYLNTYQLELGERELNGKTKGLKVLVGGLWILTLIQIILGTRVRSAIEVMTEQFPLLLENEILQRVGTTNYAHSLFALILLVFTIITVYRFFKRRNELSDLIKASTWIMSVLFLIQVILGMSMEIMGIPQILQVLHLWVASLCIGNLLVIYTQL
jgi:cytochrome c oxidase assembly protein subunit 15